MHTVCTLSEKITYSLAIKTSVDRTAHRNDTPVVRIAHRHVIY